MQDTIRRLAMTGIVASALVAAAPVGAQQFTMKLSQPKKTVGKPETEVSQPAGIHG